MSYENYLSDYEEMEKALAEVEITPSGVLRAGTDNQLGMIPTVGLQAVARVEQILLTDARLSKRYRGGIDEARKLTDSGQQPETLHVFRATYELPGARLLFVQPTGELTLHPAYTSTAPTMVEACRYSPRIYAQMDSVLADVLGINPKEEPNTLLACLHEHNWKGVPVTETKDLDLDETKSQTLWHMTGTLNLSELRYGPSLNKEGTEGFWNFVSGWDEVFKSRAHAAAGGDPITRGALLSSWTGVHMGNGRNGPQLFARNAAHFGMSIVINHGRFSPVEEISFNWSPQRTNNGGEPQSAAQAF